MLYQVSHCVRIGLDNSDDLPSLGEDVREKTSFYNTFELSQISDVIHKLMDDDDLRVGTRLSCPSFSPTNIHVRLDSEDIGVISPYIAQTRRIRNLDEVKGRGNIKVGSVEAFQGQVSWLSSLTVA